MNTDLLAKEVQLYINSNINADVSKIVLGKSPFAEVSAAELANQIAAKKKAEKKLPTWFNQENIIYPSTLSIEQTSSEDTAAYKQQLIRGSSVLDITAGFGVDSYYFAKKAQQVFSCEINPQLSEITAHNASVLGLNNINCLAVDGLAFLEKSKEKFGTIYVDPARRNSGGKVFKLADCTPNVVEHLDLLLQKAERVIIKTSPLLDIHAGLSELREVSAVHILSIKNECKELVWILDAGFKGEPKIVCATLNADTKQVEFPLNDSSTTNYLIEDVTEGFLYEADAALMKSGAFNAIANLYDLQKLGKQSHLYYSKTKQTSFAGRIFEIDTVLNPNELKKAKQLTGNVIVRNFPEKAENLVKKFKIKPDQQTFYLFTQLGQNYVVVKTNIVQYY
ncbi:class I SAM-dependent methyltransferase [Nubsella zeaxanthinifaciens]|jgi:16S rRNA G966 N2-methylase RsmD|uniref:class I SAM-dependent methyltransferase n=1 Tax=Nubsella zeaxanthinifaciens TaxID=392412 RepID=UPI000DE53416|nr:class I SAM-dependent methyltransferase [Nubsella zeaxanthinifaciens]